MSSKKVKSTKASEKSSKASPKKKSKQLDLTIPDCWINELALTNINDEDWKCSVALLEEDTIDASIYLNHFNEHAKKSDRLAVKALTNLDVIQFVVKNMVESNPGKEITPLSLLCREIFKTCGPTFESNIPTSLLVCIIKYIIIDYKTANIKIRAGLNEKKKELDSYQESLWNVPKSGKLGSSKATVSTKTKTQSDKSGKSTKVISKPFTKLRKRGEEWKDVTWVDDAPIKGFQLYIAVSTFFNVDLTLEFIKSNIPLHAVIKVSAEKTPSFSTHSIHESLRFSSVNRESKSKSPSVSYEKRRALLLKIKSFWQAVDFLKNELPTSLVFENIMFLQFIPELFGLPFESSLFGKEMYDQISHFLYSSFEITELHKNYLNEIKCVDVSEKNNVKDITELKLYNLLLDNTPPEVITVPFILDCLIEQICAFDDVANSVRDVPNVASIDEQLSKVSVLTENTVFMKLLDELNYNYDLHDKIDKQAKSSVTDSSLKLPECKIKRVLKCFDDIAIKTFHLENSVQIFVKDRTKRILLVAWQDYIGHLSQNVDPLSEEVVKRCNQIINKNEIIGVDETTLFLYIYVLIVNNMLYGYFPSLVNESTCSLPNQHQSMCYNEEDLCENCLLEIKQVFPPSSRSNIAEEHTCLEIECQSIQYQNDDLCDDCLLEVGIASSCQETTPIICPKLKDQSITYNHEDLCEQCLLEVKRTNFSERYTFLSSNNEFLTPNIIQNEFFPDNTFLIEYLSAEVMVQKIQAVSQNCDTTAVVRCPLSNQVVLVFHSLLPEGSWLHEEKWRGVLRTRVPVRDFVDYILEEECAWLNGFESKSEKSLELIPTSFISLQIKPNYYSSLFTDDQFISCRSLKYETLQKQLKLENTASKSKKAETPATGKRKGTSRSEKSSKKDQNPMKKALNQNKKGLVEGFHHEEEKKHFAFTGYDPEGPVRFQFDGHHKVKLLKNDCRVTLNTIKKLYRMPIYSLILTMRNHSLYYEHKVSKEFKVNPFHLILSSGTILSFSPTSFPEKHSLDRASAADTRFLDLRDQSLFSGRDVPSHIFLKEDHKISFLPSLTVAKDKHLFEIPLIYDLQLSLPSGLHCELVHTNKLFYIRQQFLSKGPLAESVSNERLRCFLTDGHLVKYMTDGTIHILCPNGALYVVFDVDEKENSDVYQPPTELGHDRRSSPPDDNNTTKNKPKTTNMTMSEDISGANPEITDFDSSNREEEDSSTLNFIKYSQTTSDGRRFVRTHSNTEVLEDLLVISTTNIANDCISCERLDGVKTKYKSDGSLITHFPDGSQITSVPFETEEVFCEWNDEDYEKWFGGSSSIDVKNPTQSESSGRSLLSRQTNTSSHKNSKGSKNLRNSKLKHEIKADDNIFEGSFESNKNSDASIRSTKVFDTDYLVDGNENLSHAFFHKLNFEEDGFVVFDVKYLIEHPNYITVEVNENCCELDLKLPMNTRLSLRKDGGYKVTVGDVFMAVDKNEVYFCETNNSGEVIGTMILNTSSKEEKAVESRLSAKSRKESFPRNFNNKGLESFTNEIIVEGETQNSILLYVTDNNGGQLIVDSKLNITKHRITKELEQTSNSISCFALDEDLSGFRLVSQKELDAYSALVVDNNGLILNNEMRVFINLPLVENESEKWLMKYKENIFYDDTKISDPSTYGKKEEWIFPFVKKDTAIKEMNDYEVVTIRIVHKIPLNQNILYNLHAPVNQCSTQSTKETPLHTIVKTVNSEINIDDIIENPQVLCKIIDEEIEKRDKANDKFRTNVERKFLHSLVNKAVISARKARRKGFENDLKNALKEKRIPPYHLSCFGQAHDILDDVLEHVGSVRRTTSSIFTFDRINGIIDELLGFVCRSRTSLSDDEEDIESLGVKSIISDLFRNVCEITRIKSDENMLNSILDKPMALVSSNDIEMVCNAINFNCVNCPFLGKEDFDLKDVLEASVLLLPYFDTLRKMLKFYRGEFNVRCSLSEISI